MAVKIRLSRAGSKKRPYYHIVIADARAPRDGRYIERVGSYNPMLAKDNPERVKLTGERITHWVKMGAKPTDRVQRFLGDAKLYEKFVPNKQTKKHLPGAKAIERMEEAEKAKQEEAEAKKQEAEAAKQAKEAPIVETPVEEAPAEAAKVEESPAENPVAEAPAEEAKAEETPAEEAPKE
ncbi:MAG: 30S ribosomal protein S16 [Alphaproteobacteria bacterium]|nr:30S ribosomal protein S16 [Alphaproteobacteria bacterium]